MSTRPISLTLPTAWLASITSTLVPDLVPVLVQVGVPMDTETRTLAPAATTGRQRLSGVEWHRVLEGSQGRMRRAGGWVVLQVRITGCLLMVPRISISPGAALS